MKYYTTVNEYLVNASYGKEILIKLREIILSTELVETVKWGAPVYTINNKNIVGLGSFKSYVGLWFFQGALLKDESGILVNAQENVTKALRQWHFNETDEIDTLLILAYLNEAIQNQKEGKTIKPIKKKKVIIPEELADEFLKNPVLESNFKKFTPGKQREFTVYISEAKRTGTRIKRLHKIIPLIQKNIGLNDKYRK